MKKCFLLFMLLFITACYNDITLMNNSIKVDEPTVTVPEYIDENPVVVGLYLNGKLVDNYKTDIIPNSDIAVFEVCFTNEIYLGDTNTKRNFNKYASNYEDVNKYKIGFMINFYAEGKAINEVIISPKDMYAASPYIYNYLYDDIHQADGSWYSHIEENQVTDNTIYSSIKLYATKYADLITSSINLTVFTYDSDDDFLDGIYRGNSKYTITIEK